MDHVDPRRDAAALAVQHVHEVTLRRRPLGAGATSRSQEMKP
jgi:hypothetical protein